MDSVPCGKGSDCPESLKDLKQKKTGQTLHFRRTTGESEMEGVGKKAELEKKWEVGPGQAQREPREWERSDRQVSDALRSWVYRS